MSDNKAFIYDEFEAESLKKEIHSLKSQISSLKIIFSEEMDKRDAENYNLHCEIERLNLFIEKSERCNVMKKYKKLQKDVGRVDADGEGYRERHSRLCKRMVGVQERIDAAREEMTDIVQIFRENYKA